MLRVFCCGLPKSGTSTLHRAFSEAGLRSCHGARITTEMWRAFCEGSDPMLYLPDVEAVCEPTITQPGVSIWPQLSPEFLRCLRSHNPGALMLLHTRDVDAHMDSMGRWKDFTQRIEQADLPFCPPGDGSIRRLIEGHYDRVRSIFRDDENFLEVAIEDGETPHRLSAALGMQFPWWGVMNANP